MEACKNKMGCHACISFLQLIERKLKELKGALESGVQTQEKTEQVLELINDFNKEDL